MAWSIATPQRIMSLMSTEKHNVKLDDIVSLCKRRGFIYQGSDIYGGLAGTWDYGPLGVALKRNIMQLWWRMFVEQRDDMYGVDAAILMNQKVWQASGHVDTFADPMIECMVCKARFRTDKLVDEQQYQSFIGKILGDFKNGAIDADLKTNLENALGIHNDDAAIITDLQQNASRYLGKFPSMVLNFHDVKCGVCGATKNWGESRAFNMMFRTNVGPVEDENSISYLRPETAQGIFTNFKNVVDSFYPEVPFGIGQQGKAFRNEISPRDFVFRSREFEQMEIEYFVHPDQWQELFEMWVDLCHKWFDAIGLDADKIHELEVPAEDRAHYSKRTIDFEFDYPIGREELMGLAYRTDFDLGNIQRVSGKSMEYRPKDGSAPFVPHVIEPSFGVERAVMAVLCSAYREDEQNGDKRVYLRLPYELAPIKVAVCPLAKNNPELVAKAREVYDSLKREIGSVVWIDSGNIGKNYRKMDEIGVPYVVTVDFETLEGDTKDTVTVRSRDTTTQSRSKIINLIALLGR